MSLKNARVLRIRNSVVSAGSGVVLLSLSMGLVGGVLWGVIRPAEKVQYYSDTQAAVLQETLEASFSGTVWFSCIAAIIGMVVGLGAFRIYPRLRSLGMEFWVGLCAALASVVMVICGQMIGVYRQPDLTQLQPGQVIEAVPQFRSYAALLVTPLVAMICYWAGLLATESVES